MTQLQLAREGKTTDEMQRAAAAERMEPERLRQLIADGTAVLPANVHRERRRPAAVGQGLRTKVNANIGTSADYPDLAKELEKLAAAEEAGADTVMDLSTGGDLVAIRQAILDQANVPLGTVPIYDAAVQAVREHGAIRAMTADGILGAVRAHAEQGVDFVTVHCGVTKAVVGTLLAGRRVCGMVSRGGTFLAHWMRFHGQENPLFERFDEVLAIAREHDVTLSLGDGMRPGAIADAFDAPQVHELLVLAELADRARKAGVQVMIEGPGHVPLHQIEAQVRLEKELCKGAPFYVLGPLVTDIAPGYDHITAAIGGAIAAAAGADFLCYVTPAEHLGLPNAEQVRQGVVAARIAAHAADIAKGIPGAAERDRELSARRRRRDWKGQLELCLDPKLAGALRNEARPHDEETCSMCGELCVFKIADEEPAGECPAAAPAGAAKPQA
ncbi:MAG TPA: phosphomethylpyrimidine synthase ThiC [Planctomycetota bacterium]|nr:phosphomethylpyrimidine synthase ThiC [Planctomycetota bacterium]